MWAAFKSPYDCLASLQGYHDSHARRHEYHEGEEHIRIARLLLAAGASKDLADSDGNTALSIAAGADRN